ncbi:MAG: hypothetical protein ABIG92_03770 [Candidatus Omnitrophota bacterium]
MKYCCNNCNFKSDTKQVIEQIKIFCLYADGWRKGNYSCGYWKLYDPTLSIYERQKLLKSIKNKNKEYEKYLQCVSNSGLVLFLSCIAIFFLILVGIIGAFIVPGILQ